MVLRIHFRNSWVSGGQRLANATGGAASDGLHPCDRVRRPDTQIGSK